ncbi:MAG: hypothetical protein CMM29_10520 [Rhodospirillaceae bacterium]|nr:hypothetical protein [Rhodospirillaceae bacterium]MBR87211.1 hypothetical protein [Rhodospirillaceae bacterium]
MKGLTMTTAQEHVMTMPEIATSVARLEELQQDTVDMVVPSHSINAEVGQIGQAVEPLLNVKVGIANTSSQLLLHIQDHAHSQIFQTGTDIGLHYGRKLLTAPDLWATNVNHWLHGKDKSESSYLLRTRKDYLRSFLSSRYKIVNNYDVALTTLRKATNVGAFPHRFDVSDTHMRLTYLMPEWTVDLGDGDTHTYGFRVSNSEVGLGAVDVKPFLFRWVCTNGLIMGTQELKQGAMHKVHRGSDLPLGQLSSRTIKLQSEAVLSEAEDAVTNCLDKTMFDGWIRQLQRASETALTDEPAKILKRTKFFSESETANILYELQQAQATVFGMVQSMTATARSMTADRRHEVETFAGKYLNELVPVR